MILSPKSVPKPSDGATVVGASGGEGAAAPEPAQEHAVSPLGNDPPAKSAKTADVVKTKETGKGTLTIATNPPKVLSDHVIFLHCCLLFLSRLLPPQPPSLLFARRVIFMD